MTIEVIQSPAEIIAPVNTEQTWTAFKRQFLRQTTSAIQYGDGEPVTVSAGRTAVDVFIDLPRALTAEEFYGLVQAIDGYVDGLGLGNVKIGTPSQFNAPADSDVEYFRKLGSFGWLPCKENEPPNILAMLKNGTNHSAT
jgi:hypothetical protein